jgi:hypothetical protein
MGVNVAKLKRGESGKRPLAEKISTRFSKFAEWLAKGYEGNMPCKG